MISRVPQTGRSLLSAAWVLAAILAAAPAPAQTPPASCARDTLFLISPGVEGLTVALSPGSRFGAVITWPELDPADATCAVVQGTESLDFGVEVTGAYLDRIDRELLFTAAESGQVGGTQRGRLLLNWSNRHVGRSGRVAGAVNLSNSGGLLRYETAGVWSRLNQGLPNYLTYTNILSLAQSPQQPERLLVGLDASTPGTTLGLRPRGLWEKPDAATPWRRILPRAFGDVDSTGARALAYSPQTDGTFAVGTLTNGVYIVRNHGESYESYARSLDPGAASAPSTFTVDALTWAPDGRLFVGVRAFGLFVTEDAGGSWRRLDIRVPSNPANPAGPQSYPQRLQQVVVDPYNSAHLLAAVRDYAVYHSWDNGATWQPAYGDWLDPANGVRASGNSIAVLDAAGPTLLVGTDQRGLWRSADGGAHWQQVATDLLPPGRSWNTTPISAVLAVPGGAYALLGGVAVIRSFDNGATWSALAAQPSIRSGTALLADISRPGEVLLATTGGGVYTPGEPIPLTLTVDPGPTEERYRNIDLGLSLIFQEGQVDSAETFVVKAQDFQGYVVWRSELERPFDLQMIGLYDKTNPETCIEGYCGDRNYTIRPGCFAEKRAACFDFSQPGQVSFFDDNVYNGFTYFYAVTTFDYGNTAGTNPSALTNDLLFSPRYPSPESLRLDGERAVDPGSLFAGEGNLLRFQVNVAAQPDEDGEEIYVFPNPLRYPEEEVRFTNLPAGSRIEVFTLDGDVVAELPRAEEPQAEANIYWDTRNPDGKLIASGIYIWRVQMPRRGDYWGKLVIIR